MTPETKERVGEVGRLILRVLVVSAAVVTLAMLPGLVRVLPRPKRKRRLEPWEIRRATLRLQEKRLIEALKRKDGIAVRPTISGRELFKRLEEEKRNTEAFKKLELPLYQPWDGWWRIVTFDIPHRKKYLREMLRGKLQSLGFYPLQKSVFVHPSSCEKEVLFLRDFFHAQPYIHVIRARHINPEVALRRFFVL